MSWNLMTVADRRLLVFRYVDRQAGPSAKGAFLAAAEPTAAECTRAANAPETTVRLSPEMQLSPLSETDVQRFVLPTKPEWMRFFEGAPTAWSSDPRLAGRLHPEFPDDLQAAFFIPASGKVEQMWVRLSSVEASLDAYAGTLLNTAKSDSSLVAGTRVMIRPAPGAPMPVWLSPAVQENLQEWAAKCSACGFDLVVVPVADLVAKQFAGAPPGTRFEALTTRCALCSGVQMVTRKTAGSPPPDPAPASPLKAPRSGPDAVTLAILALIAVSLLVWLLGR